MVCIVELCAVSVASLAHLGRKMVTCHRERAIRPSGGCAHDSTDMRGLDAATMYRKRKLDNRAGNLFSTLNSSHCVGAEPVLTLEGDENVSE